MPDGPVGGKDAGSQRRRDTLLDQGPGNRIREPEGPDTRARERLDVPPAPERLADVGSQAADVRARSARDAHADMGRRPLDQLERVDAHPPRRPVDRDPGPGELVETPAAGV